MSDTEDLAALNDRLMAKNHALAEALSRAGKELTKAKSQLAQLAQPPLTFATMVKVDSTRTDEDGIQHASAEVISGTRRMVVPVASNVNAARLTAGATVMLNEKLVLVEQRDADTVGQIRSVKQVLDDGRLIVTDASGNPVLIRRSGAHQSGRPYYHRSVRPPRHRSAARRGRQGSGAGGDPGCHVRRHRRLG